MAKEKSEKSATDKKVEKMVETRKQEEITLLKEYDKEKDGKLSNQAQGILLSLKELGKKANRQELITKMSEHVQTVQPMTRIYQHYRNDLIDRGFIAVKDVKVEEPKKGADTKAA